MSCGAKNSQICVDELPFQFEASDRDFVTLTNGWVKFSGQQLIDAGLSARDLVNMGYTHDMMIAAGFCEAEKNTPAEVVETSGVCVFEGEKLADLRAADEKFFAEAFTNFMTGQPQTLPYDVKRLATRICRAYGIRGICDPMYIANVAALELGRGDGVGNFTDVGLNAEATKLVGARIAELERQKTALLKMESALNDLEALAIGAKREHLTRDNLAATMHARIQTCRAALAMARGK